MLGTIAFVFGVLAAIAVFASYLFTNQKLLRMVNLGASILFVLYGLLLGASIVFDEALQINGWVSTAPTYVLNLGCAIVHIVYLIKGAKKNKADKVKNDEITPPDPVNDVTSEESTKSDN